MIAVVIGWVMQLGLLVLLAPLLTDLGEIVRARLAGRPGARFGTRWNVLRAGWARGAGAPSVGLLPWLALGLSVIGVAIPPFLSAAPPLGILADPLAVGLILLGSRGALWVQACGRLGAGGMWRADRAMLGTVRAECRMAVAVVPLLALLCALVAIGLPGTSGVGALAQTLRLQAAPSLAGGLAFVALAALVLLRDALDPAYAERFMTGEMPRERAVCRMAQDVAACGWLLLIGDLAMPGLLAADDPASVVGRLLGDMSGPARLAIVAVVAAFLGGWWPLRGRAFAHVAVLAGAGTVLVLAGRISA